MKFVLVHGAFGSPQGNWFPELKEKLVSLGQQVIAPQFPVDTWEDITQSGRNVLPKQQLLTRWLSTCEREVLPNIRRGDKACFVGHSLGPLFILHIVNHFNLTLDSAIFVSPFLVRLRRAWQIDHVNQTFYKIDFDFEKLTKRIPVSYVLYSDNDPYVGKQHSVRFADALNSSLIYVKKAGHMNSEVNLNEFPLVFDLCLTRLDLTLYQRYLEHRRNLYSLEYVRSKPEGIITLKPEEIIDEGVFHFRHLQREGFCTFFTRLSSWDPRGRYYEDARAAAKRVKKFTRVFIVEKPSDIKRKTLLEQMRLDLNAGIAVYICRHDAIKGKVQEPDFGIWDDDYVCIIRYSPHGTMKEIELNSTREGLTRANRWKREVLRHAKRMYSLDNLEKILG